jgi:hypothetical protein
MEMLVEEIKFNYDIGAFGDTLNRVILRDYPHRVKDFTNSFISNQIRCKVWLVKELKKILDAKDIKPKRVTVLGAWYGYVIAQLLVDYIDGIEQIDLIDMDEDALLIGRKFIQFSNMSKNVKINYINEDINFFEFDSFYTQVVINTSCEHMYPMNCITFQNDNDVIYCLQSNDMEEIREHVNCVKSVEELAKQSAIDKIYYRGTHDLKASVDSKRDTFKRFMIIGKRQ